MVSIMASIPKVITGPGSKRAIQSKTSNGTKAKSTSVSAKYIAAMSGAVSNPPTRAPVIKLLVFIGFSFRIPYRSYYNDILFSSLLINL
jgi:hypothetical protein